MHKKSLPSGRLLLIFTVFSLIILGTMVIHSPASATASYLDRDGFYFGINYPGVSAGYQFDDFGAEMRVFGSSDILIYGLRGRHNVHRMDPENSNIDLIYYGIDIFYIDHEGTITEGDGYMVGLFGGIQTFFADGFSLNLDLGPYHIALDDDISGVDSSGLHFVLNAGVGIHF